MQNNKENSDPDVSSSSDVYKQSKTDVMDVNNYDNDGLDAVDFDNFEGSDLLEMV